MRLAIDFDGTIADTNRKKAEWILGRLGIVVEPWQCDRTSCVPIIGAAAYEEMSDVVYERESTLKTPEVPGAAEALARLANRAELHVVTARPSRRVDFAREWLLRNKVLTLIKDVHSSQGTSKELLCRTLGAAALVDDDLRHLEDVKLAGLQRILLQYDRDEAASSTGEVVRCRSWPEVLNVLGS